ncbi:MAG: branched-chain amino acid transporter permease [Clostridia bacterium]|jgi:branched-chain amino acid transport system permease protein|nr:branched-chain amino acid transporter permease [Clostridia bacterium]
MDIFVNLTIAGLATGMMYYLLSSGLSLIYGLMGVLNFAHGSVFMYGCYAGVYTFSKTGNFALGIIAAVVVGAIVGWVMERVVISKVYGQHLAQMLLTTGLMLLLNELIKIPFGSNILPAFQPESLQSSWQVGEVVIVKYRVFLIVLGLIVAVILNAIMSKTKLGMTVRAGVQNPEMVQVLGINIKKVFSFVFLLGSALSALGGALMAPALGAVNPEIGLMYQMTGFMVVVIGGMGSLTGTLLSALLVGLASSYTAYVYPDAATAVIVIVMIVVLLIKPSGLFGKGAE